MDRFKDLIARWPHPHADTLARDMDVPFFRALGWQYRDSIPAKYWPALIKAGEARGIEITADALMRMNEQRVGGLKWQA